MAKYTLYQLIGKAEHPDGRVISPHVWKTKLDLAYFDQEVKAEGKTFPQIRGELVETTKNSAVTVPTIVDDEGLVITDSWKIAEYLEAEHGSAEKSVFGGQVGKEFAKFVEIWSNTTLANEFRPLIAPAVCNHHHLHLSQDHEPIPQFTRSLSTLTNLLKTTLSSPSSETTFLASKRINPNSPIPAISTPSSLPPVPD